jgi:hypothetical protein
MRVLRYFLCHGTFIFTYKLLISLSLVNQKSLRLWARALKKSFNVKEVVAQVK